MNKRIYVASTFVDLVEERALLRRFIRNSGNEFVGIEDIPSQNWPEADNIYAMIDSCDYCLFLIGERYGSIAPNGKSYLDNEWEYCTRTNKKILSFVKEFTSSETIADSKLNEFRNKLFSRLCVFWRNQHDLLQQIDTSIKILLKADGDSHEVIYRDAQSTIDKTAIITDIKYISNAITHIYKNPSDIHKLTSRQFEELIAELFTRQGYNVQLTKATRDGGKDLLILENKLIGNFLIYTECKKYAPDKHVGINLVRELYGTIVYDRATAGILITSSHFSKDAIAFTEKIKHQMSLIDYNKLKLWLEEINTLKRF